MRFLGETSLGGNLPLIERKGVLTLEAYEERKAGRVSAWDRLWRANDRFASLTENSNAQGRALEEARQNRRKAIIDATGEDIGAVSHGQFRERMQAYGPEVSTEEVMKREYDARLKEAAVKHPGALDVIRPDVPIEQDAYELARQAGAELEAAQAAAAESGLRKASQIGAALGGGLRGALRDPVQVSSLAIGGGPSAARTLGGRILSVMFTEAVINGGVEAAVQASSADWKQRAGLNPSLGKSLEQVGLAALFGGGFGGLLEGSRAAIKALNAPVAPEVLERAIAGEPDAVASVGKALGRADDPAIGKTLARAAQEDELDAAAFGPQVIANPGQASRALNAVENETPLPDPVDTPRPDFAPENFTFFDPAQLQVDAARFQFKAGGDDKGVTERLRGVERWNPERAGVIVVFEDEAGRRFVADGHQRTALARRVSAATGEQIKVPGYVFRARDGFTAEDVRLTAALKNVAEGSGSAIDAAKVLRGGVSAKAANLPPSSALVRDGAGLARLSDDAFTMAVNGVVKEHIAAVVGRLSDNRALDAQMLGVLKAQKAANIGEAESMVRDLLAQATVTERQDSLFGAEEVTRMLLKERAQVRSSAMNALKKDRQVFAMLADEEARVTGAGNVLDSAANRERANEDATLIGIIERLVNRTGPVADAFNAAAKSVAGGASAASASRGFVDAVRAEIGRAGGDLGAIGRDGPQPGEALPVKPPKPLEPGSPEAAETAQLALIEARGADIPVEGKAPDIADMLPAGTDAEGRMLHVSHADLIEDADRDGFFGQLIESCKE